MSNYKNETILTTIECGIGQINYEEPDNLLLQQLMEKFSEVVGKSTPKKVLEILTAIV